MKLKPEELRAAYVFLKRIAFHNNRRLPSGKNVDFIAKPLKNHGYHALHEGRHYIWIDTSMTKSVDHMLKIMAHEMLHAALQPHYQWCGDAHDTHFRESALAIEAEMGWPKGSI